MDFIWDEDKNHLLKRTRNISFEEIVVAFEQGDFVKSLDHLNQHKYPNQKVLLVKINNYICAVPAIKENDGYTLLTIYPSRKYTKMC
jgi:uncharacterized DUF497 family protein